DLGREPVHQELHPCAGLSNSRSATPAWKRLKVTVDRYGHLTQDGRERCRQVVATTFQGYLPEELAVGLVA
ncbi:hypothetical protein ACFU7T_32125, partial [Streptomyces sp. NPDC057555]|uniref:hypothetical protein n=1 Tax=Streptomyces sp. NPDC057555 TaxID=3346166 RepID=UPI00369AAFA7